MLFSLDQMLLFIEIYATLLFPNFMLIFYQFCFGYKSLVFLHYFKVIKEFTFLIYLSMLIDNSSKPLLKTNLFFALILIMQVKNLYQVYSHWVENIPASFHLRFLKIADITVFLLFFIQNLLSCCGDIEENPGPKYSSLTFCHWNLNGLTPHDYTKILFKLYA